MKTPKAPAAPAPAIKSADINQAWQGAMGDVAKLDANTLPQQVWDLFSPQLMDKTPFGFDPEQAVARGNQIAGTATNMYDLAYQTAGQVPNLYKGGNEALDQLPYLYQLAKQMSGQTAAQMPGIYDAAGKILNTGFDPQNELRARNQQRTTDTARVGQAARGIQYTPYGAGLEDQAMRDFNLDWEDRQLARQTQAAQGASTLYGTGANLGSAIGNFYAPANQTANSAAQLFTAGQNAANSAGNLFTQGNQANVQGTQLSASIPNIMSQYASGLQSMGANTTYPQQLAGQLYANLVGAGSGAQQGAYANQLAAFNSSQQAAQNSLSGMGSLFGSLIPLVAMSDRRLKRDIKAVGSLPNGLVVYDFRYHWDDVVYRGLMADEVMQVHPEAVLRTASGFLAVDYGKAVR